MFTSMDVVLLAAMAPVGLYYYCCYRFPVPCAYFKVSLLF